MEERNRNVDESLEIAEAFYERLIVAVNSGNTALAKTLLDKKHFRYLLIERHDARTTLLKNIVAGGNVALGKYLLGPVPDDENKSRAETTMRYVLEPWLIGCLLDKRNVEGNVFIKEAFECIATDTELAKVIQVLLHAANGNPPWYKNNMMDFHGSAVLANRAITMERRFRDQPPFTCWPLEYALMPMHNWIDVNPGAFPNWGFFPRTAMVFIKYGANTLNKVHLPAVKPEPTGTLQELLLFNVHVSLGKADQYYERFIHGWWLADVAASGVPNTLDKWSGMLNAAGRHHLTFFLNGRDGCCGYQTLDLRLRMVVNLIEKNGGGGQITQQTRQLLGEAEKLSQRREKERRDLRKRVKNSRRKVA